MRQGAIHVNGIGDGPIQFTQVFGSHYVFRCSGPFASPTFSGGSCAGRTSLPLPPVARFATSGGAAVAGPPRLLFVAGTHVWPPSAAPPEAPSRAISWVISADSPLPRR